MYSVYGDESHDAERVRVFAVAGVFGSDTDWAAAKSAWLIRTNGIVFHASDCESDAGDFAQSSHHENQRLYRDLTTILARSGLLGFGTSVSLPDYNRVLGDKLDYKPYFIGFLEVVCHFAQIAHLSIPQAQVKYTFEHNNRVEYDAASVYEYALGLKEWPYHKYLYPEELSFGFRTNASIQMADLLARETMKHWDNQYGPVERRTRASFRALQLTRRFKYRFFGGNYFDDLLDRSAKIHQSRRAKQSYLQWLSDNHLSDTVSARIKYQFFADQIDRRDGHLPSLMDGPGPVSEQSHEAPLGDDRGREA